MSRTQDLVLARLRLIALRWQGGIPHGEEVRARVAGPGVVGARGDGSAWSLDRGADDAAVAEDESPDPDGPGPGVVGSAGGSEPPVAHPGAWALGADADSGGSDVPADPPTWPASGLWVRLVGLLVAICALGGGGLLLTSWPREQPAVRSGASAAPSADPFADPFAPATPSPSPSVMVHVVGEVRDPGVVELPAGSRVVDAVRAAGGLRRGGELGGTNLARVLADGERIEVGGQDGAASGVAGTAAGSVGPLDLNTATAEQLDALPGIGPVTAAKILAWRSTHNRFSVVDELAEVPGIGPKTLADLRPLVRV